MGAWIETVKSVDLPVASESHPMWVRGLKQPLGGDVDGGYSRTLCGCVD